MPKPPAVQLQAQAPQAVQGPALLCYAHVNHFHRYHSVVWCPQVHECRTAKPQVMLYQCMSKSSN